jgi:tetratricopeptide (TPR) repeat protein
MMRNSIIAWAAFMLVLSLGACSKKLAPSNGSDSLSVGFDQRTYNYYYVEGIHQKLMGNSGDALKNFERALIVNPKSDGSYYQIAQILAASGDLGNSKKFLNRAIDINGNNIWYLVMMAGFYYQERNMDSAIVFYEKAAKIFPDDDEVQVTLGNLYSQNKEYAKAISVFEAIDKKYGINDNSTVSGIKAMINAGEYDRALEKANILIKDFPDELLYKGLLAEIYRGKGESDKARGVYRELLDNNPDDSALQLAVCEFLIDQKDYQELFVLLNNVVLNQKIRKEDKITLYAKLIEIPDVIKDHSDELLVSVMVLEAEYLKDEIVPMLRPEVYIRLGKLGQASDRLETLISENPDNYYAWEKLLLVYNSMKEYNKLFVRGEECATKFNRSFLAKVLFANAAIELKKYEIALDELRKADILAGEDKDSKIQVLTMKADIFYRMKKYEEAFKTFRDAMQVNGDDLTVMNNYAYYLAEQDQNLKEAEELARRVVETEKNNSTYLDTYAWVLYKRGKLREAQKIMEEIIGAGKVPDAEWYEHYGFILKKRNDCTEAVKNWNEALKLDSTKTNLIEEIDNCRK